MRQRIESLEQFRALQADYMADALRQAFQL